jgi:hypothetical protein
MCPDLGVLGRNGEYILGLGFLSPLLACWGLQMNHLVSLSEPGFLPDWGLTLGRGALLGWGFGVHCVVCIGTIRGCQPDREEAALC